MSEIHSVERAADSILVVEDEFFIALAIEQTLRSMGFNVIGPVTTVEEAIESVRRDRPSGAIVDINLHGQMAYPAVDQMLCQKIPFIFATGYSENDLPERFRHYPRVGKPFDHRNLRRKLNDVFSADST